MNNDQIRATDGVDESYGTKSASNGVSAGRRGMNSHSPLMTNGALVHRFIEEHKRGAHKRVWILHISRAQYVASRESLLINDGLRDFPGEVA